MQDQKTAHYGKGQRCNPRAKRKKLTLPDALWGRHWHVGCIHITGGNLLRSSNDIMIEQELHSSVGVFNINVWRKGHISVKLAGFALVNFHLVNGSYRARDGSMGSITSDVVQRLETEITNWARTDTGREVIYRAEMDFLMKRLEDLDHELVVLDRKRTEVQSEYDKISHELKNLMA